MDFTCTYCEKPITCMAVIIDSTHIFHRACEKAYKQEQLREKVIKKWEDSGLLKGLKGPIKEDIADLYDCCKTAKLE